MGSTSGDHEAQGEIVADEAAHETSRSEDLVVSKYPIPSKAEWVTVAPVSDLAGTFAARAGGIMAQCV